MQGIAKQNFKGVVASHDKGSALIKMMFAACVTITLLLCRPALTNTIGSRNRSVGCPHSRQQFTVSILVIPPYTIISDSGELIGILGDFFDDIIHRCLLRFCGLSKDAFNMTFINSSKEFQMILQNNMTDFALPVSKPMQLLLRPDDHDTQPLMMVEQIISSPGYSLIMDVENVNVRANKAALIKLYTESWPITVFAFVITGISGMVIWILETHFNDEEFPRSFVKGSYEGFWWAFVTMTTVGYGDKTPKFILGRVFGVFWIMFGLIVVAVFTATATSAISTSIDSFVGVEGNKIGVLNSTSAEFEARKKGAFVKSFSSIEEMFSSLRSGEIDGVLMDKFRSPEVLRATKDRNFRVFSGYDANVPYYLAVHNSLRSLFEGASCIKNRINNQDLENLFIKYLMPVAVYNSEKDSYAVFSGHSPETNRFLVIVVCVFLGFAFVGITAEVIYKTVRKGNLKVRSREDRENGNYLREVGEHSASKPNLANVENKLRQLVEEVSKLQEQISAKGRRSTTHM